jgi:hypothetical protein
MIFQSNLQSEGVQFSDKTMEGVWCFPNGLTGPLRSLVSAPAWCLAVRGRPQLEQLEDVTATAQWSQWYTVLILIQLLATTQ